MKCLAFNFKTHPQYKELKEKVYSDLSLKASFILNLIEHYHPELFLHEPSKNRIFEEIKHLDHGTNLDVILHYEDICSFLRSQDLVVNIGRGSSTSSLVLFGLGITQINPLDYDFIFESFYDIKNKTFSIQLEVPQAQEVFNYLTNKFPMNFKRVCSRQPPSIVSKINSQLELHKVKKKKAKQVIDLYRSVQHVYPKPPLQKTDFLQTISRNSDLLEFFQSNLKIREDVVDSLDKDHRILNHPCAFLLLEPDDIVDTHISPVDADFNGLHIFNVLSHQAYDILTTDHHLQNPDNPEVFKAFKENSLPPLQKRTMELFPDLKIESLQDIAFLTAFARPAIIENQDKIMNTKFSNRCTEILSSSQGKLCYQDQAMKIISLYLKCSNEEAVSIYKKLAKNNFNYLDNSTKKIFEKVSVLTHVKDLAPYLFSRSHAISVAYIEYHKVALTLK